MNLLSNINAITLVMIGIFIMPLLTGMLNPISSNRIHHSLLSIMSNVKFILGIFLTFSLFNVIFSGKGSSFFDYILRNFPSLKDLMIRYNHDIMAYLIVFFILQYIILWGLGIITIPLYRNLMIPFEERISSVVHSMSNQKKRILSVVWQLPKSIVMVLIFSLLLSFYTNYVNNPPTEDYIKESKMHQIISRKIINPVLSTDIVQNIPVFIDDSIKKATEDFTPENNEDSTYSNYWKLSAIKYFNGMTLDQAVKSNSEIDQLAKKIVENETNEKAKARLLYDWVSRNIQYDKDKVEIIEKNAFHVNSGSIVTYTERKGICFDYSCLYVSMCRAVGLKVRFVTGMGYSGTAWGDHAWNQVYDAEENHWINVDTTFGNSMLNFFDNSDFSSTHKYEVIQGEW